jgi:hypothetical protein
MTIDMYFSRVDHKLKNLKISEVPEKTHTKNVLAVDIGVQHMGLVASTIINTADIQRGEEDKSFRPLWRWIEMVNLKQIQHKRVSKRKCQLHHSNEFADRIAHLIQEYPVFDECDVLLVERQPVVSAFGIAIMNLLMNHYRNKITLVSPNSMHKHFGIRDLDYDQRKEWTVGQAKEMFGEKTTIELDRFERKHDIADAACITEFWCHRQRISARLGKFRNPITHIADMTMDEFFDLFRYKGADRHNRVVTI